jgi:hypothetical protein
MFGDTKIGEHPIDRLSRREAERFAGLLDEYGLWGEHAGKSPDDKISLIGERYRSNVSGILLEVLQSPQIIARFEVLLKEVRQKRQYHRIVVSVLALTVLQVKPDLNMLYEYWGDDVTQSRFRNDDAVRQLCRFDSGEVRFRSAVAAKFLLQKMSDPALVIEVLSRMAKVTDQLSSRGLRVYEEIMTDLMKFKTVSTLIPIEKKEASVYRYYESIKNLVSCRRNHQFWLQYAVAALVMGDVERSGRYIETAYSYARSNRKSTYQIDNHRARQLLETAIQNPRMDNPMQLWRESKNTLLRQMKEKGRYHYPYRVASKFLEFFEVFEHRLATSEVQEIERASQSILDQIESKVGKELRDHRDVRNCRDNLVSLVAMTHRR